MDCLIEKVIYFNNSSFKVNLFHTKPECLFLLIWIITANGKPKIWFHGKVELIIKNVFLFQKCEVVESMIIYWTATYIQYIQCLVEAPFALIATSVRVGMEAKRFF